MPRLHALLPAIALIAWSCGSTAKAPPLPTAAPTPSPEIRIGRGQPIIIGVSAALTGDQLNLGADIADAAELALIDHAGTLRGRPVQLRRQDDGCTDAEKSVGVARAFMRETALAGVVGPMCTTGAQAADSVYEAAHIVHISAAATRSDLSEQGERYFFRTAWRDEAQAAVQSAYAFGDLAAASAILIDDGEPYGKALADAFTASFEGAGGRVISRERVERGGTDFARVARQAMSVNPPLVVYEGLNPEGTLTLKALREAGYAGSFMGPDGLLSVRDFLISGGAITEGAVVTGGAAPDPAFVSRFHDHFQRDPGTPFVLQAHDAISALLAAIDAVAAEGGDGVLVIDRERLAEKLRTQRYDGLTGRIEFDEHGDRRGDTPAELGLTIYRVVIGRFEVVR